VENRKLNMRRVIVEAVLMKWKDMIRHSAMVSSRRNRNSRLPVGFILPVLLPSPLGI
jgi:hypothetical protein